MNLTQKILTELNRENMRYFSGNETAKKWNISERSVQNYCAQGRVNGAFLTGRTWNIQEEVADKIKTLLMEYNTKEKKNFEGILDFYVKFERIHPFQNGNGRVGRLIMFKECLKHNIVPFIIEDNLKLFYYRGLKEWDNEKAYLTDT